MKTFLSFAALIMALIFAGLWFVERQGAADTRRQLAALMEQDKHRLEASERTIDGLKVQRAGLSWEVASLQLQVRALRGGTNISGAAPVTAVQPDMTSSESQPGMEKLFPQMLKNPEVKRMIQQQQKTALESMYLPLFKELNLTPEETEGMISFMAQRAMQGVESASTLFGNDPQARDEALKQIMAEHEKQEQELKAFLGEERYAKFTDYSETAGDRMMLNQFTSMNSVSEDQTRQLLDVTKEERRRAIAEAGELQNGSRQARELEAWMSEEGLNELVQRQERVNAHVLERAKAILSPEQMEAFGRFQASQIEMQRVNMNMTRTMFGGNKPEGAISPSRASP